MKYFSEINWVTHQILILWEEVGSWEDNISYRYVGWLIIFHTNASEWPIGITT